MPKTSRRRRRPEKPKNRKLSVMVLHRIKDTMELSSSVETHRDRLTAAIGERYSPELRTGEELPNVALLLELAVRGVRAALRRLIRLDDAVDHASTRCDLLRQEQDRLVRDEAYPAAVSVRGSIDLAFGRKHGVHVHGMKGRTGRRATPLKNQLEGAVRLLTSPKLELPPPKNAYVAVDRDGWIRQLEPLARRLTELHRRVVRCGTHSVPALVGDKRAAMEDFDGEYRDTLRQVTAAFKAARFDIKLLKNLKPYYERRRLSRQALKKRRARAAAADNQAPEIVRPDDESERIPVPKPIVKWLEKNRLFGT